MPSEDIRAFHAKNGGGSRFTGEGTDIWSFLSLKGSRQNIARGKILGAKGRP
jgi:hypothetical protein